MDPWNHGWIRPNVALGDLPLARTYVVDLASTTADQTRTTITVVKVS